MDKSLTGRDVAKATGAGLRKVCWLKPTVKFIAGKRKKIG